MSDDKQYIRDPDVLSQLRDVEIEEYLLFSAKLETLYVEAEQRATLPQGVRDSEVYRASLVYQAWLYANNQRRKKDPVLTSAQPPTLTYAQAYNMAMAADPDDDNG